MATKQSVKTAKQGPATSGEKQQHPDIPHAEVVRKYSTIHYKVTDGSGKLVSQSITLAKLKGQAEQAFRIDKGMQHHKEENEQFKQAFSNIVAGIAADVQKEYKQYPNTEIARMFKETVKEIDKELKDHIQSHLPEGERARMPRAWTQSKSDTAKALELGIDTTKYPTARQLRDEKLRLMADSRKDGNAATLQDSIRELQAIGALPKQAKEPELTDAQADKLREYVRVEQNKLNKRMRAKVEKDITKYQTENANAEAEPAAKTEKATTKRKPKTNKQANADMDADARVVTG